MSRFGVKLGYELVPFKLRDGTTSPVVFFLCKDGEEPCDIFPGGCRNDDAIAKMLKTLETVHGLGVNASRAWGRVKPLKGGDGNDLFEIAPSGCTTRAYSFLIDDESAIAVAFVLFVTHSGAGKKVVNSGIKRLRKLRPALNEALRKRSEDGSGV